MMLSVPQQRQLTEISVFELAEYTFHEGMLFSERSKQPTRRQPLLRPHQL